MTGSLSLSLAGKRALITGASSGLGAHFATVLARQGANLVLAARRTDKLEEVAKPLRDSGCDVHVVSMDVSDSASVKTAFVDMPICNIVVNNSGVGQNSWLADMSEDEWQRLTDTNLSGVWRVSKSAIAKLRASEQGGVIINIASIAATRTALKSGCYAATKAAVEHLTRSLAVEVARDGIRVNALAPGYFRTQLNTDFLDSDAGQRMATRVPLKRFGNIKELDYPLLLLAVDQNSYMTGATLTVDGGHCVNSL